MCPKQALINVERSIIKYMISTSKKCLCEDFEFDEFGGYNFEDEKELEKYIEEKHLEYRKEWFEFDEELNGERY